MPRGKYTLKPKAMRRMRDQIERNRIRVELREARLKRQKEQKRKEENQRVLEARVSNEQRREEQKARVNEAIRRLANSVR